MYTEHSVDFQSDMLIEIGINWRILQKISSSISQEIDRACHFQSVFKTIIADTKTAIP